MSLQEIQLKDVSRYRGELMGAAILFIVLFHVELPRSDAFFGLRRCGNIGVDMFLFLSGLGLWFSWVKNPSFKQFYQRRLLRIFPAWLIMSSLYYIPRFDMKTGSYIDLIGDITINWDFWLHDELTFWYIPAIMMLYLWAPLYMHLIRKHPVYRWLPVLMIVWCICVQWVTPIHQAVGHIEIFWSRVPIFFLGINFGEQVRQDVKMEKSTLWLLLLVFLATASACIYLEQVKHGRFPLFAERMIYIPLTVSLLMLLTELFRHTPVWLNRSCAFLGTLSLELYLIHHHFVMVYISPYHLGYWLTFLLTLVIAVPLAWLLHQLIKRIMPV
ncbi:MAG: acyltransferase [Prevotella sp.]|nr:acyltransferase [Prevotella sp.]